MSWYRIIVPSMSLGDIEFQILDWFQKLVIELATARKPIENLAVFSSPITSDPIYCFFTPELVEWADLFIKNYPGEECDPPLRNKVGLLCGDNSAWDRLPTAKDS